MVAFAPAEHLPHDVPQPLSALRPKAPQASRAR